jgi:hypothetical protein
MLTAARVDPSPQRSGPAVGGGQRAEPELDRLSNSLSVFNEQFGNVE